MTRKTKYEKKVIRGQMKPLTSEQLNLISGILQANEDWRGLAIFRLGIDSLLRASDLVRLHVKDVIDDKGGIVEETEIELKKTGGRSPIHITGKTAKILEEWLRIRGGVKSNWLFPGGKPGTHITEVRCRQLLKGWVGAIGLNPKKYAMHSLRRTRAAIIYKKTGNLKAVSQLLGHKDTKETEKYIGIGKQEAIDIAREVDF
jgi:integrase